jgi:hypothetical protein
MLPLTSWITKMPRSRVAIARACSVDEYVHGVFAHRSSRIETADARLFHEGPKRSRSCIATL